MDTKVLLTYTTLSGSTAEVAEAIKNTIDDEGITIDLLPLSQVENISSYDAVIMGAPMVLGWHRDLVSFIVQNQETLKDVPVAYFVTQLHLTKTSKSDVNGSPIYLDPKLAKLPANPDKMNLSEKKGTPESCVGPAGADSFCLSCLWIASRRFAAPCRI